jgi:hypothetical protein
MNRIIDFYLKTLMSAFFEEVYRELLHQHDRPYVYVTLGPADFVSAGIYSLVRFH